MRAILPCRHSVTQTHIQQTEVRWCTFPTFSLFVQIFLHCLKGPLLPQRAPSSSDPMLECTACVCVWVGGYSLSLPRSISEAFGLCEYGVPLYTASSSFSFTCVTVSQFRLFTVTSGEFSFSGFTQCSVYKGRGQRAPVTSIPGSQHRLGVLTIDVGKHDPVIIFDLQHFLRYWNQYLTVHM